MSLCVLNPAKYTNWEAVLFESGSSLSIISTPLHHVIKKYRVNVFPSLKSLRVPQNGVRVR